MNLEFSKTDKTKAHLVLLLVLFGSLIILACLLMYGVFTLFAIEELADARMQYEIVTELSGYFLLTICVVWSLILYGICIMAEQILRLQSYPSVEDKKE
jgi:hypothetical protein